MKRLIAFALLVACNVCAGDDVRSDFRALSQLRSGSPAPPPPADGATAVAYLPVDQLGSPGVLKFWATWCDRCKDENVTPWLEQSGWPVTPINVDQNGDGQIDPEAEKLYGKIEGLPTFAIVRNKAIVARYTGNSSLGFTPVLKHAALMTGTATSATDGDASPTPYPVVFDMLEGLDLKPTDRFGVYGSGDGRVEIAAAQRYGCKVVGIEIDPERAAEATRRVQALGLEGQVTITVGDATKIPLDCNKAYAYLYPGTLVDLRPQIDKLERFATYQHALPWRSGTRKGDVYFYGKVQGSQQQAQPATEQQYREVPYALYGGWKYYGHCCGNMSCPMGQEIMRQLAAREHIERVPVTVQRTGYCRNCGD